jgi:hypothetical protein
MAAPSAGYAGARPGYIENLKQGTLGALPQSGELARKPRLTVSDCARFTGCSADEHGASPEETLGGLSFDARVSSGLDAQLAARLRHGLSS